MAEDTDETIVTSLAEQHGVSRGAVETVLKALRSSGGSMAQFSHPDFGGMCQWSRGMTMVGDMFNDGLKAKLDAIATELSAHVAKQPAGSDKAEHPAHATGDSGVSYTAGNSNASSWWPDDLGKPHSTGAQNAVRYAIFDDRLVIDDHGNVTTYDTGGKRISGIAQAQGSASTLTFTGGDGLVKVSDLEKLE